MIHDKLYALFFFFLCVQIIYIVKQKKSSMNSFKRYLLMRVTQY